MKQKTVPPGCSFEQGGAHFPTPRQTDGLKKMSVLSGPDEVLPSHRAGLHAAFTWGKFSVLVYAATHILLD